MLDEASYLLVVCGHDINYLITSSHNNKVAIKIIKSQLTYLVIAI